MTNKFTRVLFALGSIYATPGALDLMQRAGVQPAQLFMRHRCGDWDELDANDCAANARSVANGMRILSAYSIGPNNERIWLVTDADRAATTALLPREY
ncbi:hypothetical protein WT58_26385 [Burkholderia territorii]|uniref:hypothetical protein n=1 Tax=Burkholderia territorii TaxID=1503055 RepID=UPI00075BFCC4|nr:hypothetical protein [Burkholderia territorii]KWH01491.1 hypothetical protein WT58_26385 [Burkholderia territorii]